MRRAATLERPAHDTRNGGCEMLLDDKAERRFWAKVERGDPADCWGWRGRVNDEGYGRFTSNHATWYSHRVSYSLLREPIPDGLVIDHLCCHPSCQNPWHMETVTSEENVRRGVIGRASWQIGKTHCPKGHEYTDGNTYHRPDRPGRMCRICNRADARKIRKFQEVGSRQTRGVRVASLP